MVTVKSRRGHVMGAGASGRDGEPKFEFGAGFCGHVRMRQRPRAPSYCPGVGRACFPTG